MSFVLNMQVELSPDDRAEAEKSALEIAEQVFQREDVVVIAGDRLVEGVIEE